MSSSIAANWGTTVGCTELPTSVVIEMNDGRVIVISHDTFNYLYFKLDEYTAALKEDCINYEYCDDNSECVILRNHLGQIMHMDVDKFFKYYDTVGGEWE